MTNHFDFNYSGRHHARGRIVIVDRKVLEKLSNGTYVPADYQ